MVKDIKTAFYIQGISKFKLKDSDLYDISTTNTSVVIPEGVTALKDGCLSGLNNLKLVVIPESIREVGVGVLSNCPNLEIIQLKKRNIGFSSVLSEGNNARIVLI